MTFVRGDKAISVETEHNSRARVASRASLLQMIYDDHRTGNVHTSNTHTAPSWKPSETGKGGKKHAQETDQINGGDDLRIIDADEPLTRIFIRLSEG